MFFKYRTCWSHGKSKWMIIESSSPKALKEHFEENHDNDYSEHFRGFEWTKVNKVPEIFITNSIQKLKKRIKYINQEISRLKKIKTSESKRSCSNCVYGPRKECRYWKSYYKDNDYGCKKLRKWKSFWDYSK